MPNIFESDISRVHVLLLPLLDARGGRMIVPNAHDG